MDNLDKILALVNAGYTKQEIMELVNNTPAPAPAPEPAPVPEPAKKEEPTPEPEKKEEPTPGPTVTPEVTKLFESIGMKLDGLTNAIQKSNINAGIPTVTETVDTILASIINPPNDA